MKRAKTMLAIICATLCISCSDDNPIGSSPTIVGSGNLVAASRTIPTFHSVIFTTVGVVNIKTGTSQSVSLTVDDNILQHIQTTVINGVLTVSSDVDIDSVDLTLSLTMTDVSGLSLTGVGSLRSQSEIQVDELDLTLTGVGDITMQLAVTEVTTTMTGVGTIELSGSAITHTSVLSGVGAIDAFPMTTDTTRMTISGVGDARVNAADMLYATINSVGSVYYKGNPTVVRSGSGTGAVVNAN